MKTNIKHLVVLMLVSAFSLTHAGDKQFEAVTKSFKVSQGGTLSVKIGFGDIYLKTWSKNEVLVKIHGIDEDEAENLKIRSTGNDVFIDYKSGRGSGSHADYTFTVPTNFNIETLTTSGDVEIENDITGDVILQTTGGDVITKNVKGNVKLETMGGDILIGDISGNTYVSTHGGDLQAGNLEGSDVQFQTMGGEIDVKYVKGPAEMVTYGGDIQINGAGGDIDVKTFGGDIKLGAVNGGVKAETYGGSIKLAGADGLVKVSSGGGNIALMNITGSVDAVTGGGSIYVELTPKGSKESYIRTNMGSIDLLLPSDAKATVEAEVQTYGWGKNDDKDNIRSDFEGSTSKKKGGWGLVGEYTINGGGQKIYLESTNGSIDIKKIK